MKVKNIIIKLTSLFLAAIVLFSSFSVFSYACSDETDYDLRTQIAEKVVETARAEIGFYETSINKYTSWYYGFDTYASWCTVFISWCANQVGALGTAVPKRAACLSMKLWFERRGEYYSADSDYIPQKGDIVFLNTEVDGTENIHHNEIITENGFFAVDGEICIKCIGGNTSNINYNGTEYVTEKTRPIDGDKATVVGYAHPSYEKSEGLTADFYSFSENNCPKLSKYFIAEFWEMIYRFEKLWVIIENTFTFKDNSKKKEEDTNDELTEENKEETEQSPASAEV